MTLERRLSQLEASWKYQDTIRQPDISADDIISKLGLDPDLVRVTAKEKNQSIAEIIAGELGMSYGDFQKALKRKLADVPIGLSPQRGI